MKKVIDFIVNKKLESIDDFPTLILPISENFKIETRDGKHNGLDAAELLIECVVYWELHPENPDSLESILNKKFCLL
mgnify:CR=1 FL=1